MDSRGIYQALLPQRKLLWAYPLIALVVLFVHSELVLGRLVAVNEASRQVWPILSEYWQLFNDQLGQYQFVSTLTLALFWSAVGGVVYILFWLLSNVGIDLHNKLVRKAYYVNKPSQYLRNRDRLVFVTRVLFRVSVVLVLLFFASFFTQVILPFSVGLFQIFWIDAANPLTWLNGAQAIVVMCLSLHMFVVLFRLVLVRDRVFDGFVRAQ